MNIVLSGDGTKENKVVFDKLLAKWGELFARQSLLDEMEAAEDDGDGELTFTNDDTELRFYQTEASKAHRSDVMLSAAKLGASLNYIAGLKFLHDRNGTERKKLETPARSAVLLTDIMYEVDGEKQLSFTFSKFTDADGVLLRLAFTDDDSDADLEASVLASATDGAEVTLYDVLAALGQGKKAEQLEAFRRQVDAAARRLQEEAAAAAEEERMEALAPAFDALDDL